MARAKAEHQVDEANASAAAERGEPGQFHNLYFARLLQLKQRLRQRVAEQWPEVEPSGVLECDDGAERALIGAVYKHMRLKPTVMDEYADDRGVMASVSSARLTSTDDAIFVEDNNARVRIRPNCCASASADSLITGVVLALRGHMVGGEFVPSDAIFPGPSLTNDHATTSNGHTPLSAPSADDHGSPNAHCTHNRVLLLSGLQAGGPASANTQLLLDFLSGDLGSESDRELARSIARVVIAGNSVDLSEQSAASHFGNSSHNAGANTAPAKRRECERERSRSEHRLRDMDALLTQLACICPTDVMPGELDPAHTALPQPPLHSALLPYARTRVHRAPNPHAFTLDGKRFVGTSGQNIMDMLRFTELDGPIECLSKALQWQHLAPSAPDTLPCHPSKMKDPFVIDQIPDVLFAGNQPSFAAKRVDGRTTLVSVPSFTDTNTAVLLDLTNFSVELLCFEAAPNLGDQT